MNNLIAWFQLGYVALNIFHLSLTTSVGIAVFGAFCGGIAAILYIVKNMHKHKKELSFTGDIKKDDISDSEIIKKILSYAIPFIIIDVGVSVYNFVDMVLISRTMVHLGFDAATTEFITSSVSAWAGKINMVVNAIAMGLTVSLIPNIVEAFTLKKWHLVESRLNKALQIIIVTCVPMVLGISLLSKPIWGIFYGTEELGLGGLVLSVYIFIALFFNIYMVTSSTLQSLNKFKAVYLTTLLGYVTNAILDVPLMLLCHALGLEPFIGAVLASILGYSLSAISTLILLNKEHKLKYNETFKLMFKIFLPTIMMVLVVVLLKLVIPINYMSRLSSIIYVAVISIIGSLVYLFITYKMGILTLVFGKEYLNKIVKKVTFGKIDLK